MPECPRQLIGTMEEPPRVLVAFGTETLDRKGRKVFYLACWIRHYDEGRRFAVASSPVALAVAAGEMWDNLQKAGILWSGNFRIASGEQLRTMSEPPSLDSIELIGGLDAPAGEGEGEGLAPGA